MEAAQRVERVPADLRGVNLPPQSIPAEQAVLGAVMLLGAAFDQVADLLQEDDFYRADHRLIWRAIGALADRGSPIDAVTLGEWFGRRQLPEQRRLAAYVAELAGNTPSAANVRSYAQLVRDKAQLRRLVEAGTETAREAYHPVDTSADQVLERAEQRVLALRERGRRGAIPMQAVKVALRGAMDDLQRRYAHRGELSGLGTGFGELDTLTSGLQRQDLVVVAGRPSMGKTCLAMNFVEHAALAVGSGVLIFSMEMSGPQLALRMIASQGRVRHDHLRSGAVEEAEWTRVGEATGRLVDAPILIDDAPALSPLELRSRARRACRECPIGLVVVDYLQLMQVPGNRSNRAEEIATISRSLKALAKELNVPVVALSQLNRALEARPDKRPVMSDLRESGAIEQDADVILFVYRDEVYNKDSPDRGTAEVIIGKQRNGPLGTVKLAFHGEYARFENLGLESGAPAHPQTETDPA